VVSVSIADWRLAIGDRRIGDWRLSIAGLSVVDCHCRLAIVIEDYDSTVRSPIVTPAIVDPRSAIRRSAIVNRRSAMLCA